MAWLRVLLGLGSLRFRAEGSGFRAFSIQGSLGPWGLRFRVPG